MAQRILDITSFQWWESDSKYRWPANSFYQWENIDIRKDLWAMTLSPMLEDTGWSFNDDIVYMCNLETLWVSNWWIVVCLDNGRVYLDWVLKHTFNTGTSAYDEVIGIWVNEVLWVQYVYYITKNSFGNWKIHRSTTDLVTWIDNHKDYQVSSTNPDFIWIINNAWLLYIAIKNKIFLLDEDGILQEYLILPASETIMGFTQFQWNYKIYTNVWRTWVQYRWDGFSESPDYRTVWENKPVLWVTNDWEYDYAVLWINENYSDLYRIAWTQKQLLRANLEASWDSRVLSRYLSMRDGILYMSGWSSWQSSNKWIYTYWNYYPWQSLSLVQSLSLSNDDFLFHAHKTATSYFACQDDKVYTMSHNTDSVDYAMSWYITSLVYEPRWWEELEIDKIKVAFETNWWSIKIYARTSFDWASYTLLKEITNSFYWTNTNKTKDKCFISKEEIMRLWVSFGNFTAIQYKIELIRGATAWNTPRLKSFTAFHNILNG